jgi:protein-tyrosine phosphatase
MAEIVLRDRFESAGLGDVVEVDSTGVSSEESGNPIDPRARRTLAAHGYDVPDRQARRVTAKDLTGQDLVLAMTTGHVRALERLTSDGVDIRMLRSFDPAAPTAGPAHLLDVDDPWYGPPEAFEQTLAEIEDAADGIIDFVRAQFAPRTDTNG